MVLEVLKRRTESELKWNWIDVFKGGDCCKIFKTNIMQTLTISFSLVIKMCSKLVT